jgi:tetratricopeptide (TPR) repeat protein
MFTITLKHPVWRVALLLLLVALLAWLSWMIIRLAIGDSLVTFARRMSELDQETRLEAAAAAVRYAPHDSFIRYQSGLAHLDAATSDLDGKSLPTAIQELQMAAQLSPEDYRVWLALGRALSRSSEDGAAARQALERAVRLAPEHFEPRWALGNFLLRAGEREAACAAFRTPMSKRPELFPVIFDAVWESYQGDVPAILRALDTPAPSRPQLAIALVLRKRLTEAMAVWKEASPTSEEARLMYEYLFNNNFYSAAYQVWRAAPNNVIAPRDDGSLLSNGGFERDIIPGARTLFQAWQIIPREGVMFSLEDQQPHSGQRALRISFDLRDKGEIILAQQNIPVAPSTAYRLSFVVRSQELKSFSPPLVEVIDTAGAGYLNASSAPTESDIGAWREAAVDFTTKPNTESVTIRILRRLCAESPCPLTGRVWFDSFRLSQTPK